MHTSAITKHNVQFKNLLPGFLILTSDVMCTPTPGKGHTGVNISTSREGVPHIIV